jgi:hypothetical protein
MKTKQNGFTIIELLIIVAFILICVVAFFGSRESHAQGFQGSMTYTCVDTRDGYEFTFQTKNQRQVSTGSVTGHVYLIALDNEPKMILVSELQLQDYYRCLISSEGI